MSTPSETRPAETRPAVNPEATTAAATGPVKIVNLGEHGSACFAVFDDVGHVGVARKMLTHGSFTDDEILIVCDDDDLRRDLYARQHLVNGPRSNAYAMHFMLGGAAIGALILGIGGFIAGTVVGVVGMVAGALAGGIVGALLRVDANNQPAANQLHEAHADLFGKGKVGVAVVVTGDAGAQQQRLEEASALLEGTSDTKVERI